MVKPSAPAATGPGVYSATYSGIPVYEYQFGVDLKEHVMRRRHDDWINATHILKAAGFDKPARTRILEREVQKDTHEKIQGGYGKYQGTWIPLESGQALATRNNVFERLRPIFDFSPGSESPPPAPRHTSKPKQPKKPAVPKFNPKVQRPSNLAPQQPLVYSGAASQDGYDNGDVQMGEDDTPDNLTVASASYMAEEDRLDMSHFSTGHRKRKREDLLQDLTVQQHGIYGDELLDYFVLSKNERAPPRRPEPPPNFQADWVIDRDQHTALHWAAAMGDVDIIKQLKRFGAHLDVQNIRGETPLMRAVSFTNCYEKLTFPEVLEEFQGTFDRLDASGCTVIHHAAVMKSGRVASASCSRYYLDNILNKLQMTSDPDWIQRLIDVQDQDGNTAMHLAAQRGANKCIRALLGRGARTDLPNHQGVCVEDMIKELNARKKARSAPQRSSSPFGPDGQNHSAHRRRTSLPDGNGQPPLLLGAGSTGAEHHRSAAASTVQKRIAPLVLDKFRDLARNYEEEWLEKDEAEREANRLLANAQAELANVRQAAADAQAQLQPQQPGGDMARLESDVESLSNAVLALVSQQKRIAVEELMDRELSSAMNGGGSSSDATPSGSAGNSHGNGTDDNGAGGGVDERLQLAAELRGLLLEQQAAEAEYVAALSVVGTGEKIDKYRHLLKQCLGPEGAENLDDNLDGMIMVMEEEVADASGPGGGREDDDDNEGRDADLATRGMIRPDPMEIVAQ